jgi:hypothetical protein
MMAATPMTTTKKPYLQSWASFTLGAVSPLLIIPLG